MRAHLSCGEERHSKLQQALDLNLHCGQRPLEDRQGLEQRTNVTLEDPLTRHNAS